VSAAPRDGRNDEWGPTDSAAWGRSRTARGSSGAAGGRPTDGAARGRRGTLGPRGWRRRSLGLRDGAGAAWGRNRAARGGSGVAGWAAGGWAGRWRVGTRKWELRVAGGGCRLGAGRWRVGGWELRFSRFTALGFFSLPHGPKT
jgi:hypothetical protein